MTTVISFCAPPEVMAEIKAVAKTEDRSMSQILRDAFREYQEKRQKSPADIAA